MENTPSRIVIVGRSVEKHLSHDRQEADIAAGLSVAAEIARATDTANICIVSNTKANLEANTVQPVIGPHLLKQLLSGATLEFGNDIFLRFTTPGMRTPWPRNEIVIALWPEVALLRRITETQSIPHVVLVPWLAEEITFAAKVDPTCTLANPHADWIEGGKNCTD